LAGRLIRRARLPLADIIEEETGVLRGKRVTLRAIEREDLVRFHAIEQNVDLAILADGYWEPVPLAKYERTFEKRLEQDEWNRFVIEVEGKMIGTIGLHRMNRREGTTQFGVGIYDPEYLGQGYGREAIGLLLDYAFRIQNWRRVWLDTDATNERAIRAYRACGFVEEGRLRHHAYANGEYVDLIVMGMLRSEWEVRRDQLVR
jgi:RimJ/RimL family protein N-acetyltransferase